MPIEQFITPLVGIVGWQNSGKTHLVVELVQHLTAKGLTVSTVKHAHHAFDIDRPGKDSFKHREAGAREVLVASANRWALMHEVDGDEPSLDELVRHLAPADIVIAEGFKSHRHPKIEVWRDPAQPLLASSDPTIRGVVTPEPADLPDCPCLVMRRDDIDAIGKLALALAGRA